MAESDIFVSNDITMDVNFGEVFVVDQGVVYKVIASKYDHTKTYVVGDYVLHLEKLYRCITAIETAEEFDAEKWTQVLLADEVQIANANIALKANASDVYTKSDTYNKTEVNNALESKADANTTYSKTEVDNALATKADTATTYTKTEVDTALANKADKTTTYTKTEVDTALSGKADKSDTYTKTEVDTALSAKANSDDVYAKTDTYSKTEIDTNIYTKSETYNKTEVDGIISNLPAPMIFKGTLGVNGTITTLPTASSDNEGFTYKVITDGTYAGQSAKVGDVFTSNGSAWVLIPSGDETFTDTWRSIKVNGTEKLGSSINTGSVDFKNGTNSTAVFDPSDNSIKINVDGYTQSQIDTKLSAKANSNDVYTKSQTYTKTEIDDKIDEVDPAKEISNATVASFNTSLASNLIDCRCAITPSLTGYTGLNITQTSGNVFDKTTVLNGFLINASGTRVSYPNCNVSDYVPVVEGKAYYLYGITLHPNTNQDNFQLYDENKTMIGYANVKTNEYPYTIPSGVKYVIFTVGDVDLNTAQFDVVKTNSYVPYSAPITYPVTWQSEAGTIYGGELDVTTGLLTVDRNTNTYNGSENWVERERNTELVVYQLDNAVASIADETDQIATSPYTYNQYAFSVTNNTPNSFVIGTSKRLFVQVRISDFADVTAFTTALSNTNLKVNYKIASQTYQLTSVQVRTLVGQNNIFTNVGQISLAYFTSGAEPIKKLIQSTTISELADVNTVSPENNQLLTYNSSTSKWENKAPVVDSALSSTSENPVQNKVINTALGNKANTSDVYTKAQVDGLVELVSEVSSAPIANFNTTLALPLVDCNCKITPTLTGATGLTLKVCGANLWDEDWELGTLDNSGAWVSGNYVGPKNPQRIIGGETYYLSSPTALAAWYYSADGSSLESVTLINNRTFTPPANACFLRFRTYQAYGTTYNNDIAILYPSTQTAYASYQGTTYSVSWQSEAGTVYGGSVDLTTGVLTVTHISFDMGDVYWAREEDSQNPDIYYFRYLTSPLAKQGSICKCSCYETYTGTSTIIPDLNVKVSGAGLYVFIRVRDDNYTDGPTFTAAVRGQNVVYELATPVTYQIDPVFVRALIGVNNVFTDVGNTAVKYVNSNAEDTVTVIQEVATPTSGYSKTVLYSNMDESDMKIWYVNEIIELSADMTQFDELLFITSYYNNALTVGKRTTHVHNSILTKEQIEIGLANYDTGEYGQIDLPAQFVVPTYYCSWVFKVPDNTHLLIAQKNRDGWNNILLTINKIIGIKY